MAGHSARTGAFVLAAILAACAPQQPARTTDAADGALNGLWTGKPTDAQLAAAAEARDGNPNRPTNWWGEISTKPDSFYRSEEGKRIAENILSWRQEIGGWPLMNTTREPFTGDASKAGPWGTKAALIKASVNEMRFLARGYRATKDERYKAAVIGGLDFILKAQHPSGGWPHSFPLRMNDYSHYATFNDDMMPDLMMLLREVATAPDFELVGKENRERAKAAVDRGVDFVLKSQIRVNGRLTAWAQQYDEVTYEPKPARAFEPVAISGGESASVLLMLMSLPRPSADVQAAVEAGVQWYRDAEIDGLKLTQTKTDRVVAPDPSAPPIWARFYEIGSGKPIFVGRDGVIRYSLAEIEQERRGGYAWYNYSGTEVFARYAAWKHERKWDAQPPTNTDEARVGAYTLPDILTLADGGKVKTVGEWERVRRPEIMTLLAQNQHGVTPSATIETSVEVVERDVPGMGGLSKRTQVRIRFPGHPDVGPIRVLLNTPAKAKGPVPTLLHLGFSPNVLVLDEPGVDEGMAWSAALKARVPDRDATKVGGFDAKGFVERGFGVAMVYYGDIYPDFDHGDAHGVPALFGPAPKTRAADEWGAIGAWAWGLSRVMDWMQTEPAVDGKKVALSGVSRLGKAALWAGAQDQRFAMVIPLLSGEGGASISKRFYGETVADLTNPARYDYWFAPRYADYAFDVADLPVDGHMLLAMIAPRPVLQIVGTLDTWSDPRGEYVAASAAQSVWKLYGKTKLAPAAYPTPDKPALGDMGFLLHAGEHTTLPIDFRTMADFMDLHFGKPR
jgi:PelA/Pel-15E family pectate lyase